MAQQLTPLKIGNLGVYGLIRPAEVDDSLIPDGAVTESINFHFDRKGAATVRPGLTALGSTVRHGWPATGLHNAQSGTAVVVFSDTSSASVYAYSGGAWVANLNEGTANAKVRFVDFGSYTIMVNFCGSIRFWGAGENGPSYWKYTGNPINAQHLYNNGQLVTPTLAEVFKSRVYLSGDTGIAGNASRLYFSSVISTAGVITWSPTINWVDLNPGDGEGITSIKRYSLEMLVFKPNYIYRFRVSSADPDPLIKVGTRSHESVVEGNRGLYFHHDSGFYSYTGGYPNGISRPISDFVDAIPYSQYANIAGWNDQDHIYWSIGNVTISEDGQSETFKNVVLRYTESSQTWTIYSLPAAVKRGISYNNGTTLTRIVGLDNGVVATFGSGTTDLGEPIKYRMRTKWVDFGSIEFSKILQEVVAVCDKAQASELRYQVDDDPEWHTVGQIKTLVNFYKSLNHRFHRIRFKVAGMSRDEAPVFRSISITKGIVEGLIKED